jgi:hypothetical protein
MAVRLAGASANRPRSVEAEVCDEVMRLLASNVAGTRILT